MKDIHSNPSTQQLIMVVEDEVQMQELMRELLESNGYKVHVAVNGREAVRYYSENKDSISLVILDVMLPEMDGRETYYELRKFNDRVKVFFCTGFASLVEIQSLIEKENLHALQKPFSPKEFLTIVTEVLEKE
jgi:two-component system, cell cycle sensor histidine kinase and response regulator CckA